MNDLTAGFGVALLDAATIDAACRLSGRTFHEGLRENLFGFGQLEVPDRPLSRLLVRHTVGLSDPITRADVELPLGDGLPQSLDEVIETYGVRWFKIKISGDPKESIDRLRRIASVLPDEYGVTLDGNEQFHSMEEVEELVTHLRAESSLAGLWDRTAWLEQPVERSHALEVDVPELGKPVIVDESDGTDQAVELALARGYAGISAKNCKGVFRTLHSFRRVREAGAVLSSEDLMNIPSVPLQQDCAVAAALGIPHSERNGHHYIRAFEYFSDRERETALREYPSLYARLRKGEKELPVVRVAQGALDLTEVNAFGFGVRSEPDWETLDRVTGASPRPDSPA
jgi:hypothetical protein